MTTPAPLPKRLPFATMLPFSAPSLVFGAMNIAVFVFLPPYFASHLGVGMILIGGVWMTVRLIDVFIDPLLAMAMDRTRTPIGRYRVWLLAGAPVMMLGFYKLFMAPAGFGRGYLIGWLLMMYLGYSMLYLAHSAWGARLATHYHERSRLFGVLTAVTVVGTMAVLSISIARKALGLTETGAVQDMGWAMILALPLVALSAAVMTPERIAPETGGPRFAMKDLWGIVTKPDLVRLFFAQVAVTLGPGWMSALYLFYFKIARGFTTEQASLLLGIYILAQIAGAFGAARLSRAIGKHRTLMVAATGFSLGLLSILIIPKANLLATAPAMVWSGMMAAGFDLMIRAMMADVGDEVRLEQGKERISLLYATNTLAQKIAAAFSIGLTFPLLAQFGFNPAEHAVNTPEAINNLQLAFIGGPVLFVMMGGACLIGWRLDARRHTEIREQLEARDARLEGAA